MSIIELSFRFNKTLNQVRHMYCGTKIANLHRFVRNEAHYSIRNKITSQEYYYTVKNKIEGELGTLYVA